MTAGWWGRVWALGALLAATALLAGCGGGAKSTTTTTTAAATTTTAPAATAGGCSSYGTAWVRSFNRTAVAQGNPERMLSACCGEATSVGVHHCFLKLTLVGTKDLGCATADLGPDGAPVGVVKHEDCALHK
jgi:hypothetical protein